MSIDSYSFWLKFNFYHDYYIFQESQAPNAKITELKYNEIPNEWEITEITKLFNFCPRVWGRFGHQIRAKIGNSQRLYSLFAIMRIGAVEMPQGAKSLAMAEKNTFHETPHTSDANGSYSPPLHHRSSLPVSDMADSRHWCTCWPIWYVMSYHEALHSQCLAMIKRRAHQLLIQWSNG